MKFDACERCDGKVTSRKVTVDLRRGTKLWVFYNVPVGVCATCGERYYPGPVLERLEEVASQGVGKTKKLSVPTYDFAKAMS